MNKHSIINASQVSAMALMVVVGWLAFRSLTASREDERRVTHTYIVMLDLEQLLSTVQDAETGQRGFIITGGESYLQPYEEAVNNIHQQLASLRNLTKDNPRQRARLDTIEATAQAKLALIQETLRLRQSGGFEAAQLMVATGRGEALMDEFRGSVAEDLAEERQLLDERTLATTDSVRRTLQLLFAAGLLCFAFLLTGLVALKFHRETSQQARELARTVDLLNTELIERKRVEDQNRVQVTALEAAANGIAITGPDGTIQWVNRAFTKLTGYSVAEAVGKNPRILKSGKHGASFYADMWETLISGRLWQGELINRRKDGSLYSEEMTIAPVFDAAGAIEHFVAVKQDMTSRNLAEEAQNRLAAIVESSEDAIVSKSLEGVIQTWNGGAERLFGYRAEEAIGKPFTLIMAPERMDEEAQVLALVARGQRVEHFETVCVAKDGRRMEVSLTVSPVKDRQGQITAASKIVRDIGEIVEARRVLTRGKEEMEDVVKERTAELREAMDELEQMSYSMVHDMRAPLRAMQGFAMLLEEEGADSLPPAGLDYIRRIRQSANRLDRLITDALNYNQVVRQHSEPAAVELGKLLRGMLESYPNLQPEAADIGIEFKELAVLGNESLLTQCFGNLLSNATKFVAPAVKPRVRVWAEEKPGSVEAPGNGAGDRVRIWVEDNGIGIPKEAQAKIFGMFQRLHRENEYPGTGIGLAIVRKAVERMGGQVALESEPGKGSRFWVELPKADGGEGLADPEVVR
jgi:PAS domain S-box-containing protein